MVNKTSYDVIIIGAGPAGLYAGRELLGKQCTDVLLLDKKAPWEHPMPCAEGVGKLGLHDAGPVAASWIRQEITTATFHAPNGSTISYTDKNGGYIINRSLLQQDIARQLIAGGITAYFSCRVNSVTPEKNGFRQVITANGTLYKGRVIIDASGPVNCFAKNEPIASNPGDLEPAYFVWVENYGITSDHIHIFAGQEIAPGGYAWIFPRGSGGANIGIVLGKKLNRRVNLRILLDKFIERNCPGARIVQRFAGSIPCGHKRSFPIALPGLIKSGDAASTVNPISRAGITEAMHSGVLAGQTAAAMLEATTERKRISCARTYERLWNKRRGNRHQKLARSKSALRKVPDADYNRGAETLSGIPLPEMTMSKIFRASLSRFPRLIWALRHLM
ncbi:MAG: NAD(P)/FAD-dependent oxidoreductase [Chitinispirillaceae bacterium]|nr:NAD(P)/FAD-dependent oxidoreductase [Chitinispirillaceae bacterium]